MKRKLIALAVLGLPAVGHAADDHELDTIIVTATRTARTADDSLASVSVITRQDIERSQAQSVQDLLRGVPGVSIANNGGAGKSTSLFLRGTESDHVLVLIDGVRAGSATSGQAAFQDIPIDQIERIEIVRGPRSSLYGSEAIGGVIQIFTRRGGGETAPRFSIGGGSHGTFTSSAGVSGGGADSWYNMALTHRQTGGINACRGKPSPGGAGCYVYEPDRDGYRNTAAVLRAGHRFGDGAEVDVHFMQADSYNEYDGTTSNQSNGVQQVAGARATLRATDAWRMQFTVGQARDEADNYKNHVFSSRFNTERDSASWQNDINLDAQQLLTLGLDYQDDRIDSTTVYKLRSRDDKGAFVQYQGFFGAHNLQASVRRDDNAQFGGKNTGNVAWGYAFNEGLRLFTSYGSAFKAPTFNELYYPGYGNANLKPEQARSFELGLSGKGALGRWSISAFRTQVEELIAYDSTLLAPNNIDHARIVGVETTAATRVAGWDVNAGLTLLDPEQQGGKYDGMLLPRRAKQSARFGLERDFGAYRLGATVLAAGRRYDDLANKQKLDGYATLDLRAEYRPAKDWRVQALLENLFDKDYETAYLYNQPGRGLYLTLRYAPK